MASLVLFNIGWMKRYRGLTESDRIFNGGRYVQENEIGDEVRNFEPAMGRLYGYVPTQDGSNINMTRLGVDADAEYADDVTVVFTATPPEGGNVVVGWYRNARVWREPRRRDEYDIHFVAEARQKDCELLKVDDRVFPVPRTRRGDGDAFVMGRTPVRYTDKPNAKPFLRRLNQYMESYMESPPTADEPERRRRRRRDAPRQSDPLLRAKVEKAAIEHVTRHYSGYECQSVERENKGWDLEFTRGARKLLVEVKGCSGDLGHVELTPNEYRAMRDRRCRHAYRLAIVTRALEAPRLSIISFNGSDKTWRDQDDREVRLEERTGVRVRTGAWDG